MKPKWIKDMSFCQHCRQEMMLLDYFLRPDESAIEVWYICSKCGKFGFAYTGGFVESFKNAQKVEKSKISSPQSNEKEGFCG